MAWALSGPSRRDPATRPQKRPEICCFSLGTGNFASKNPEMSPCRSQKPPTCPVCTDVGNRCGASRRPSRRAPALYKKVRARVRCARTVPPVGPFPATDHAGRRGAMAQTTPGGRRVLRIARAQAGVCRCGGDALQAGAQTTRTTLAYGRTLPAAAVLLTVCRQRSHVEIEQNLVAAQACTCVRSSTGAVVQALM